MPRNKSIRCGSRAWPNFGLMSFSSIIYLLLCRKRQKKVVAHLAQCMLVNTKTRAYGLSHNILFSRRLCIKFFRAIIKIVSTRVFLKINDIIGSHKYTAAQVKCPADEGIKVLDYCVDSWHPSHSLHFTTSCIWNLEAAPEINVSALSLKLKDKTTGGT